MSGRCRPLAHMAEEEPEPVEVDLNQQELDGISAATALIEGERAAVVAEYEAVGTAFTADLAKLKAEEAAGGSSEKDISLGEKFGLLQARSRHRSSVNWTACALSELAAVQLERLGRIRLARVHVIEVPCTATANLVGYARADPTFPRVPCR